MFINACSPPEAKIPLAESCTMSSLYSGIFNIISYQYHFTPISYDDHVFTPFSDLLSVITDYVIILHSSWKCVLVGITTYFGIVYSNFDYHWTSMLPVVLHRSWLNCITWYGWLSRFADLLNVTFRCHIDKPCSIQLSHEMNNEIRD